MLSLLLDSSGTYLNIGIAKDGRMIDKISQYAWQKQSEIMIPEIIELFKKHEFTLKDINSVVTSLGPGSYTGVRIALTITKILGLALPIKVYSVSSLKILKKAQTPSICRINARRGRYYVGVYQGDQVLLEDGVMEKDSMDNYLTTHPDFLLRDLDQMSFEDREDIFLNLIEAENFNHEVKNIHTLKPVYLKDL